jgi:hypothetical protein
LKDQKYITDKLFSLSVIYKQSFLKKSSNLKVVVPKPDLSEVNATLDAKLTGIQQAVEKKPVPVIHQLRFQLFPETNTDRYYEITLGRILPWFTVVILATYLFSFSKYWLVKWQNIKEQEIETNVSARAWDSLYKKANVRDRRALDKLWEKTARQ